MQKLLSDKLKPGDILVMKPIKHKWKYPVSTLISWVTKTEWTHSSIYIGNGNIIEAVGNKKGVQITNLETSTKYKNDYTWRVLRIKESFKDTIKVGNIINYALSKQGHKYDFLQATFIGIIAILHRWFKSIVTRRSNNIMSNDRKFFCAELVAEAIINTGFDVGKDLNIRKENILAEDVLNISCLEEILND